MLHGKTRPGPESYDVWRQLAAAVVHRAIFDAAGRQLWYYTPQQRQATQAQAQRWLLSDAGAAFLALLDLDHEAVLDALTRPSPNNRRSTYEQQYKNGH